MTVLRPRLLTREGFAPFGDVIETVPDCAVPMNEGRFDRFADIARIEAVGGGSATIGIVRCRQQTSLPYRFRSIERHPLGSQAFVPLARFRFFVVVASAGSRVLATELRAFVTNGHQGINYRRGTWHMPLIALAAGQEFLVIDRSGPSTNWEGCDLDAPVTLAPWNRHQ